MRQIQLTITARFIERAVFILIILVLALLLVNKYMDDTSCDCPVDGESDAPTTTTPDAGDDTTDTQTDTQDTTDDTQTNTGDDDQTAGDLLDEMQNDSDDSGDSSGELSGEVEVVLGKIDWEIQNDSRARINNIQVSIENGLDDQVKLFATMWMTQSGNDELENYNPVWDSVEVPVIDSGEKKLVTLEPSRSWPPGVEDNDNLLVDAEFTDLQDTINVSASKTYTVG